MRDHDYLAEQMQFMENHIAALEEEVARLKEDLAEALSAKAWNPMEVEFLPGHRYLLSTPEGVCVGKYSSEETIWRDSEDGEWITPTHWMPLPDPPKT